MTFVDGGDHLDGVSQAAPAAVELDPEEIDRRSELIRRIHFELAQRAELKAKGSPATKRLVELVRGAVEILEREGP